MVYTHTHTHTHTHTRTHAHTHTHTQTLKTISVGGGKGSYDYDWICFIFLVSILTRFGLHTMVRLTTEHGRQLIAICQHPVCPCMCVWVCFKDFGKVPLSGTTDKDVSSFFIFNKGTVKYHTIKSMRQEVLSRSVCVCVCVCVHRANWRNLASWWL